MNISKERERLDSRDPQPDYSFEELLAVVGAFGVWLIAVYGARAFWLWMIAK